MTEPVVEPHGEARQEWEVIDEIARGSGSSRRASLAAALLGKARDQALAAAARQTCCCASGPKGDLFGLRRGGLNLDKLRENPHGIVLAEHMARRRAGQADPPPGGRSGSTRRRSSRTPSGSRPATATTPEFPLRLIGLRELRSHNSWMHNAPLLMRGGRDPLRADPPRRRRRRLGIDDGEPAAGSPRRTARSRSRRRSPTR